MVRKRECAFLCKGNCRLCKGACSVQHDDMTCKDAIRRAVHHSEKWSIPVRMRPMESAKARFRLATEGSRGWEVYRTCKSKRRYQSPEIAHKEARQMARRYGKPMGSYYCKFCGGYHLTSKARRQNCPELVSLEVAA